MHAYFAGRNKYNNSCARTGYGPNRISVSGAQPAINHDYRPIAAFEISYSSNLESSSSRSRSNVWFGADAGSYSRIGGQRSSMSSNGHRVWFGNDAEPYQEFGTLGG